MVLSRRSFVKGLFVAAAGATFALAGCSSTGSISASSQGVAHSVVGGDWIDPATYKPSHTCSEYELQRAVLFVFDTTVTLRAYCTPDLMTQMKERCLFFEEKFSRTYEGSDIWNINHAGGASVEVEPETADCITKALAYAEQTDGLFDITIGAVSSLWDFGEGIKPADEEIQEAVKHVDYRKVKVDGNKVTLSDSSAMLDLGGIAKGYIADDLAQLLMREGCPCAILNLGGNAYTVGSKPDGSKFAVGISSQIDGERTLAGGTETSTASVVTSGLYERQFTQDGVLYYHILDVKTGYPVKTDLVSDSLVCSSSTDGDVYATTFFLMGYDAALSHIQSDDRFEGLLVKDDGTVTTTSPDITISVDSQE